MAEPTGKRILTIVTNRGVEQDELIVPAAALRAAGAEVTVAAERTLQASLHTAAEHRPKVLVDVRHQPCWNAEPLWVTPSPPVDGLSSICSAPVMAS